MLRALLAGCAIALLATSQSVLIQRPPTESWKRTQCGGPNGKADIPSRWASEVSPKSVPLTAYPRPQMVRGVGDSTTTSRDTGNSNTWFNLNGLWEWEVKNSADSAPQFGKTLTGSILVPFPVESCLSGVAPQKSADIVMSMRYRLVFSGSHQKGKVLLHFGAVDWQTLVYFDQQMLGNHTGGYDGFSFDITEYWSIQPFHELIVDVYDPSDKGRQPNGKQRISAIDNPGGDTYTPNSGIWQTVWLEFVPVKYIKKVKIDQASLTAVTVISELNSADEASSVQYEVRAAGRAVASGSGKSGDAVSIIVPSPKLWSPDSPFLYDLVIRAGDDEVLSYFGLRTFVLGNSSAGARPLLNGKFTFMAGFLDQSWWPDGQYTAPTDEALESDLIATKMFGLNMIRLHQKINPERWYYHADRNGLVLFQDMVQKYGGASTETIPYFLHDMRAAIEGRGNHPCIVQFQTFNEGDCWQVFKDKPYDVEGITELAKKLDPTRLVDTDSGGGANKLHIADVNDVHSYPFPGDPTPSSTQYAMVGEFGGIGAFIQGKEWVPGKCHTYLKVSTPQDEADKYVRMANIIKSRVDHLSASVYTQTTDVELECDGFLNYDRSNKFNADQTKAIHDANQAIIQAGERMHQEEHSSVENQHSLSIDVLV